MSVRSALKTIMNAIRVTEFGGPQVLKLETNVPIPKPAQDEVPYDHLTNCCHFHMPMYNY